MYKGKHVFADFTNFKGNEHSLGLFVYKLMIKAINRTNMKIVHRHLEILNTDTPPGFTSVLLLDESHFTAHAYTEEGLLAVDIFTCGNTDPKIVMNYFQQELQISFPEIECVSIENHMRFKT
jgi:S-adenosylmethionine decarboxylase